MYTKINSVAPAPSKPWSLNYVPQTPSNLLVHSCNYLSSCFLEGMQATNAKLRLSEHYASRGFWFLVWVGG